MTAPCMAPALFAAALLSLPPDHVPLEGAAPVRLEGTTFGYEGDGFAFTAVVENPEGEALTFEWDFGDGSPVVRGLERGSVTHRYTDDDRYELSVRVQGSEGLTGAASVSVQVANADPVIHSMTAGPDALPGEPVRFQAHASDPGEDELLYTWDFGDGETSSGDEPSASHAYQEPGEYGVTLAVEDGDGGLARQVVSLRVLPEFEAVVSGDLGLQLEGTAGEDPELPVPAAIRLPALPGGSCALHIALEDPQGAVLRLIVRADELWQQRAVPVADPQGLAEGWISRGMVSGFTYVPGGLPGPAAAGEAPADEEEGGGGLFGKIGGALGDAVRVVRPRDVDPRNPGVYQPDVSVPRGFENYAFTSRAGVLRITRITQDRMYAHFDLAMEGARQGPEPGDAQYPLHVNVSGRMVWRFGDHPRWRQAMQACGERPFTIAEHTPGAEEDNLHFRDASIQVRLTRPYDPSTVTTSTVQVGYIDRDGTFRPAAGRIAHGDDGASFSFVPDQPLIDRVYYRARISGGEGGIRSEAGETMAGDYEWRFATAPDLVASGAPGPGSRAAPEARAGLFARASGGPSADASAPHGRGTSPAPRSRTPGAQEPRVECAVFQTIRNPSRLIQGKPALVRVYVRWDPDDRVAEREQVEEIQTNVEVSTDRWRKRIEGHRFVRPDLYGQRGIRRWRAEHTANLYGWRPSEADGSPVEATVEVVSSRSDEVHEYQAMCGVDYWDERPKVRTRLHLVATGDWGEGVPASARRRANEVAIEGKVFSWQSLPISDMEIGWPTVVQIEEPGPVWTNPDDGKRYYDVEGEFYGVWTFEYLVDALVEAGIGGDEDVLDLVFVPPDILDEGLLGRTEQRVHNLIAVGMPEFLDRWNRLVVLPLLPEVNGAVLAHEVIHWFGGDHCPPETDEEGQPSPKFPGCRDGIEGFKLRFPGGDAGWNKSQEEGNGEALVARRVAGSGAGPVYSLMCPGQATNPACARPIGTDVSWTLDFMYDALFDMVAERLASAGPSRPASLAAVASPTAPPTVSASAWYGAGLLSVPGMHYGPWEAAVQAWEPAVQPWEAESSAPRIRILSPRPGEEWSGVRTVRWEGEPGATYTVSYRSGPTDPWRPVGIRLTEPSLELDTEHLQPGERPAFRVAARESGSGAADASSAAPSSSAYAEVEFRLANDLSPLVVRPEGEDVDVNEGVFAAFPTELDPGSIHGAALTLEDEEGESVRAKLRYHQPERSLTLVPKASLRHGTTYTARLGAGVRDRWRRALGRDIEWTFRTREDVTPPRVIGFDPKPGALGVAPDARIRVVFDEEMDPDSFAGEALAVVDGEGTPVDGSVRYEPGRRRAVFTPAAPLEPGTTYTVTVEPEARDAAGNPLAAPRSATFTTAGELLPLLREAEPPQG